MTTLLILIIILALLFDFVNGFHDAANSIATVVSTRVLTPLQAVLMAGSANFIAYFIFELHVADTVAKTVHAEHINLMVILAGLIAATVWNLFTWWMGLPSSSSHTLIGGFAGAGIANAGTFNAISLDKIRVILLFIVLAPLIGMVISYFFSLGTMYLCRKLSPHEVDGAFRKLQVGSAAFFSLMHGGNDAQKVVGIIAAALIAQNQITDLKHIPNWVPFSCYVAIGLGTMMGGWRIVKTMGHKVTKLTPFEGFAAETGGAITLLVTGKLGIPVSTTHTITGSIIGTGMLRRVSAVRWGVTISLMWAWIFTIPISAMMGALFFYIGSHLG
ncbi:MAG TPA: inorganic phosphate transporter [Saprospiraceae bacterium]|nr:inorganic phosphate transporter [Saprospiraceae bacterium]HNT22207.1 inorganic phosphate transporter [Saprospiraceae bacterium]